MGTRNLTIVKYQNEYKIAQYCQWDGYPSGQGVTALDFLKNSNLNKFKKNLSKVKLVKELPKELSNKVDSTFTLVQQNYKKFEYNSNVTAEAILNKEDLFLYKCHTRDTGAEILNVILNAPEKLKEIYLINELDFAKDSLFCEWAYVIDFDTNTFEVYKGFNKNPLKKSDRFYNKLDDRGYYPIKLLKKYQLDKLPNKVEFKKLEK